MARRKPSVIEDLYDIFLRTPWWISPLVAGAAYAVLNFGLPAYFGESNLLLQPFVPLGPIFAPWAAGFILMIGIIAQIRKRFRRKLLEQQSDLDTLRAISWQNFEKLVGEAYRRKGYHIEERGGEGADGGVDLVLSRQGKVSLVQCKQWKAKRVGVSTVRELYGIIASENAAKGILVTCGQFTPDAKAFAKGKPLELVEGKALLALIETVQKNKKVNSDIASTLEQPTQEDPNCPICGEQMILRKARKGNNAGQKFWGCRRFPQCRGTRNYQ